MHQEVKSLLKKTLPFLLLIFIFTNANAQRNPNKRSALFGEQSIQLEKSDSNVVRVFIDQHGFYYPDFFIKDRKLRRQNSSIKDWLAENTDEFNQIANGFSIPSTLPLSDKINALNDSIIQTKITLINEKMEDYEAVVILIHGFRKKAYGKVSSTHSTTDNDLLRSKLSKVSDKTLFVEIYWDGTYVSPMQSFKYRGLKLMENVAIPHAKKVGVALRKLVTRIKSDKINILSHSLGAIVVANLLFNATPADLPTPSQAQVNICLIAPAIGYGSFENYYDRNSTIGNYKKRDNYNLAVVYNENDFALHKTFVWGIFKLDVPPTTYGDTSLGCNCDGDVEKLQGMFQENFHGSKTPFLIKMNERKNGDKMLCHGLGCYARNYKMAEVVTFFK